MQTMNWAERFSGAEFGFVQERPYPVASPVSVEALVEIVHECSEQNWRVLPLGQGSSFPPNFSLRTERTFAITTAKLRDIARLSNGRTYCQPGLAIQKVLLADQPLQRKTMGGLICGTGDQTTRNAARSFWQTVQCVEVIDAKGRTIVLPGPACAQYTLGASSTMLLESRGKAGIVVGIEFCTDELPMQLGTKKLSSTSTENLSSPISRQVSVRSADALSLFDW